jgi:16S rRNA processing protein RimM
MSAEELVAVARAVKTRGLKGEIVAEMLTDFPERFDGLEELTAVAPNGQRFALTLTRHWFQGPRIILQFAGYDTPERARKLIGCELAVLESEAVELLEDEFYDWELAGCRVETLSGEHLGQVREVLHYGPNEVLAIDAANQKREYLIPFAAAICVEVDIENKLIRVNPPDGLLEF